MKSNKNFSFGSYAHAPYDMITREYAENQAFHEASKKIITTIAFISFFGMIFFLFIIVSMISIFFFIFVWYMIINKNSKQKIVDVVCYGIDYWVMGNLEKTGKIKISPNFRAQLLDGKSIQKDLSSSVKNIFEDEVDKKVETPKIKLEYKTVKTPETTSTMQVQNTIIPTQESVPGSVNQDTHKNTDSMGKSVYNGKRKSIFDDYVSVTESFGSGKKGK